MPPSSIKQLNPATDAGAGGGGEEILVLYGSQTGNSEDAAQQIASLVPLKLASPSPCTARCMHLDDFLEIEGARWPRLLVVVCSSYGVGHAPIGALKFRDVCDAILSRGGDGDGGGRRFLEGVSFALLGLGDSHYSTFFMNPTTIHEALTRAGAERVGELGKADASGTGDDEQSKVVERWISNIWDDLSKVIAASPPAEEVLERAREETWALCLEVFPEWKTTPSSAKVVWALGVSLGGIVLAALVHYFWRGA